MTRESWSERAIPGFITIFFFFSPSVFFLSFFFYSTYVVWTRDCCIFPSWRRVSRTRRRRRVARFGPAGCQHAVKATLLEPESIMQTSWYLERKKRMSKTRRLGMDIKSHQFSSLFPSMMMMILFLSLSLVYVYATQTRWGKRGPVWPITLHHHLSSTSFRLYIPSIGPRSDRVLLAFWPTQSRQSWGHNLRWPARS